MNLEEQLNLLKQKVLKAFDNVPHPKGIIAPHECEECYDLRETFENKNWKTIDPKILEENFDQLPLFSGESFQFFLPAYLLYSLENFNDNLVCEFTIYSLSLNKDSVGNDFDYWKERFQNFTDEQMETIYDFLCLDKDDENGEFEFYQKPNVERLRKLRESIEISKE